MPVIAVYVSLIYEPFFENNHVIKFNFNDLQQ